MTAWHAVVVSLAVSLVAAAAEAGVGGSGRNFTQFPVPNGAGGIAIGPTGDVWFTANDRDLGRIATGADGRIWFSQQGASSAIGRLDSLAFGALDVPGSAVSIALGSAPYESCSNADADGDGGLRINDLIASVTSALRGCAP